MATRLVSVKSNDPVIQRAGSPAGKLGTKSFPVYPFASVAMCDQAMTCLPWTPTSTVQTINSACQSVPYRPTHRHLNACKSATSIQHTPQAPLTIDVINCTCSQPSTRTRAVPNMQCPGSLCSARLNYKQCNASLHALQKMVVLRLPLQFRNIRRVGRRYHSAAERPVCESHPDGDWLHIECAQCWKTWPNMRAPRIERSTHGTGCPCGTYK